jgi:hypothetical protein
MSYGVVDFAESYGVKLSVKYNRCGYRQYFQHKTAAVVFPDDAGMGVDSCFGFDVSVVEMNDMVSERGEFSISMWFLQVRISCLNVSEPVIRR